MLTIFSFCAKIPKSHSERYRSGHNEAVLKTVWGKPHMGSNPILSAIFLFIGKYNVYQFGVVLKLVTGIFYECCQWQIKRVKNGVAVEI